MSYETAYYRYSIKKKEKKGKNKEKRKRIVQKRKKWKDFETSNVSGSYCLLLYASSSSVPAKVRTYTFLTFMYIIITSIT